MATYAQIQDDIKTRHGLSVKTCWIAHVKELNGLPVRKAHNRAAYGIRQVPCPRRYRQLIEDSMRRFGMLDQ